MPYTLKEPNKNLILIWAGIFFTVVLMTMIITFYINRFIMKENFVLKKPMVLLLIGMDVNMLTLESHDNPNKLPRTDTLILAFLDSLKPKIFLISIPKDSLVDIPGHGLDRINNANILGGYELTKRAVTVLTGLKVDRYAAINFAGFIKLVDLVGGVEINVDKKMCYANIDGQYEIKLDPGLQLLNGQKALEYVRFRNEPMGDIRRVERQRNLLLALYKKVLQPENLAKIPKFLEVGRRYLKTDLTAKELLQLSDFARQVNPEKDIVSTTLPGNFYETYWQPDPAKVYKLMNNLKPINPKK